MVAMSGMPWLGVGDLFCCGHVGAGGTEESQVSGVFAIQSMWYWLIGFLLAFRSIWPYDMVFSYLLHHCT
jgi:hypothetical protein